MLMQMIMPSMNKITAVYETVFMKVFLKSQWNCSIYGKKCFSAYMLSQNTNLLSLNNKTK